ncbi:MAG TPA: hypothetical protein VGG05_19245 [Pseudonocardiaceae bacterium]
MEGEGEPEPQDVVDGVLLAVAEMDRVERGGADEGVQCRSAGVPLKSGSARFSPPRVLNARA